MKYDILEITWLFPQKARYIVVNVNQKGMRDKIFSTELETLSHALKTASTLKGTLQSKFKFFSKKYIKPQRTKTIKK